MFNPNFDLGDRVKLDPDLESSHQGEIGEITGVVEFIVVRWPDGTFQTCDPNTIEPAE